MSGGGAHSKQVDLYRLSLRVGVLALILSTAGCSQGRRHALDLKPEPEPIVLRSEKEPGPVVVSAVPETKLTVALDAAPRTQVTEAVPVAAAGGDGAGGESFEEFEQPAVAAGGGVQPKPAAPSPSASPRTVAAKAEPAQSVVNGKGGGGAAGGPVVIADAPRVSPEPLPVLRPGLPKWVKGTPVRKVE